jgi:alpha-L-arabinofuranosidase
MVERKEPAFREDVKQLFKELKVPIIRYPGGQFCMRLQFAGKH